MYEQGYLVEYLILSLPESIIKTCSVALTFKSGT